MDKKQKKKTKFSIYWLFGKIGDILFIPVLVISLLSSLSMLVQKRQNTPSSFLGFTLVNILSGSMTDAGLKKGDTVITKYCNVEEIDLGDVIAFYEVRNDPTDTKMKLLVKEYHNPESIKTLNPTNQIIYSDENITISTFEKVNKEGAYDLEYAQKNKKRIIFHMVIGIYVDADGSVFYETKGTNSSIDIAPVRSDFVIGRYVSTPQILRDTMSFCASGTGMILLVCLPLSVLVMLQCFSLIKQIETMNFEKQLLKGKRRFDDEGLSKDFNGNEIEIYNKAYLYYLTDPSQREQLLDFMWGELLTKEKKTKKDKKLISILTTANDCLSKSSVKYWQTWINGTKGYTQKKIKKFYEEIEVHLILNNSSKG